MRFVARPVVAVAIAQVGCQALVAAHRVRLQLSRRGEDSGEGQDQWRDAEVEALVDADVAVAALVEQVLARKRTAVHGSSDASTWPSPSALWRDASYRGTWYDRAAAYWRDHHAAPPTVASDGVDEALLSQSIGRQIGSPSTCVVIADAASGKLVWRGGGYITCSRNLPTCDGDVTTAEALLQANLGKPARFFSCDSGTAPGNTVGWAIGPVPTGALMPSMW